jgi:acetate kinase
MKEAILIINAGSSSIKFSVFLQAQNKSVLQSRGQIEGIGVKPNFVVKNENNDILEKKEWTNSKEINHEFLMKYLIDWLNLNLQGAKVIAAGHRVVHGGTDFTSSVLVTDDIITKLEKLIPLAPLHQPHNLSAIKALKKVFPDLPQVACFDTSFHCTNPDVLRHFFIPRELEEKEGVRRYGFHGLSYEFITKSLQTIDPQVANKKVIVAHLGSGSSMCAMDQGKSIATSMGLTALDGLPMGTRPGILDPGVVLYLMREKKMDADQIENLLYKKSGLLGLSGINNDMRILEESSDPRAVETIDAFVWKVCQMVGNLAATVQGFDALVFTAGIGENSTLIRKMVSERLAWLGLKVDQEANLKKGARCISTVDSKVKAFVIPTNEELMIAEHVVETL